MGLGILMGIGPAVAGDKVRVGALRLTSSAPIFIAVEQGLFKADDLCRVEVGDGDCLCLGIGDTRKKADAFLVNTHPKSSPGTRMEP